LVLATSHAAGAPVPVSVAGVLVGWAEFQVVGDKLALRIAEME
jgi:flagellar motor switch/type III secretory pathway protein FliN